MSGIWKGRSFLTLKDYQPDEIRILLDLAHEAKKDKIAGRVHQRFMGKTLALIFEKRSTRTRCAFETAFGEEGGHSVFLSSDDIHLGVKESLEDTGRVLGRMFNAIQFRGYAQRTAEILRDFSGLPVYNGLTDDYHPTQALADLMTIEEVFGRLKDIRTVYVGDARNNTARSLMIGCAKMGVHYTAISPASLQPDDEHFELCRKIAEGTGSRIERIEDLASGVEGADVVYTDVWVSMGEEAKSGERLALLRPYQVNEAVMRMSGKPQTVFLHDLPAVKGNEVTADVIDGPRSRAWDQAENRKHTIKAVMLATL